MNQPPDILWIDVGGTRTTAWRRVNAALRGVAAQPSDAARLPAFVRKARGKSNTVVVIGLRGAWTAAEKNKWRRTLKLKKSDRVLSDIELGHEVAFAGGDGIVLNAGTGSIAYGKRGAMATRAGGLGPLIGDEGSAFWIGREYMRRISSKRDTFDHIRAIVTSANPVASIAAQAKQAVEDAGHNRASADILVEAQRHLVKLVIDVGESLKGNGPLPLVLRGGLFENGPFRKGFEAELKRSGAAVYFRPVS